MRIRTPIRTIPQTTSESSQAPLYSGHLLILALLGAGCTYGPPELHPTIANHVMAPGAPRVAFALLATRSRAATGLSTFPDGGVAMVLNEAAAVYLCDTLSLRVDRPWQMDRPAAFKSGFGPWMGPWTVDGIYFSVRGDTTPTIDPAAFRRIDYLLGREGVDSGYTEPPPGPATSEPQRCAEAVRQAALADPPFTLGPDR